MRIISHLQIKKATILRIALLTCLLPFPSHADVILETAESDASPFSALEPVLAGEFALQAGKLSEASRWYLQAAQQHPHDVALAERATRLAMMNGDDERATQALALWAKLAPQTPVVRSIRAWLALRQGDAPLAQTELLALLRANNGQDWPHALAALSATGRDEHAVAEVLTALVDANVIPDNLEAWQAFSQLALRMQQPELMWQVVNQMQQRFPDEPRVQLLYASQLHQAGQHAQALALLQHIHAPSLHDEGLRYALAFTYDSLNEAQAAEQVLAQGPQDVRTWGLRASLLSRQHDQAGLLALYQEMANQDHITDPAQRLLLGQLAEQLELYVEALSWYRGQQFEAWYERSRLHRIRVYHAMGEKTRAFNELHAIQANSAITEVLRRDAWLLEATLHQRDDDGRAEIATLTRALAAWPDDTDLLYSRALAFERNDDIARAEADLRKILLTDPENAHVLNALGYTLADRTTRWQEALELIERARLAEPDNAAITDSYGWVLYRLGQHERALVYLRQAWFLAKDAEIAAHVGEVLWVLEKKEQAKEFFIQSQHLEPDNRALKRVLERFNIEMDWAQQP